MAKLSYPTCRACGEHLTKTQVMLPGLGVAAINWACMVCETEEAPHVALGRPLFALFPPKQAAADA